MDALNERQHLETLLNEGEGTVEQRIQWMNRIKAINRQLSKTIIPGPMVHSYPDAVIELEDAMGWKYN